VLAALEERLEMEAPRKEGRVEVDRLVELPRYPKKLVRKELLRLSSVVSEVATLEEAVELRDLLDWVSLKLSSVFLSDFLRGSSGASTMVRECSLSETSSLDSILSIVEMLVGSMKAWTVPDLNRAGWGALVTLGGAWPPYDFPLAVGGLGGSRLLCLIALTSRGGGLGVVRER
jgi:hypothetical protein